MPISSQNADIRILVSDNQKLFRDGLHSLLEKQHGLTVVGTAENCETAVRLACQLSPHIVVLDINRSNLGSMEATRRIKDDCPETKVIALSKYSDKYLVEGMLKAGVSAYLLKNCSIEELCHAIKTAVNNRTYFCQEVARSVVQSYLRQINDSQPVPRLTVRERQVLQQITDGRKTSQVADSLKIGVKTVETYRRQIMKKLKLSSIAELTKYAIREGITTLD